MLQLLLKHICNSFENLEVILKYIKLERQKIWISMAMFSWNWQSGTFCSITVIVLHCGLKDRCDKANKPSNHYHTYATSPEKLIVEGLHIKIALETTFFMACGLQMPRFFLALDIAIAPNQPPQKGTCEKQNCPNWIYLSCQLILNSSRSVERQKWRLQRKKRESILGSDQSGIVKCKRRV